MDKQKQKIVKGAKQYAQYIITNYPQKDENGNILYYISGSLAMLLLNSATSIKVISLDKNGKTVKESEDIKIPLKNKESLEPGIRQLGHDVDVIVVDDERNKPLSSGIHYNLAAVKQNCSLATELCPNWAEGNGTVYLDILSDIREFSAHDIAELTIDDGSKVIIADPLNLIVYKFSEAIKIKINYNRLVKKGKITPEAEAKMQKKYQKDIIDFVTMFNAIVPLFNNLNFNDIIGHLIDTSFGTTLSQIICVDSTEYINQFVQDAKQHITKENQELFDKFITAMIYHNKECLASQAIESSI